LNEAAKLFAAKPIAVFVAIPIEGGDDVNDA